MQVQAHEEAAALFEQYSRNGNNAELKAANTLPHLKEHLAIAKRLDLPPDGITGGGRLCPDACFHRCHARLKYVHGARSDQSIAALADGWAELLRNP